MQPLEPNLNVTFTYKDLLFRKLYKAIKYSVFSQFLILHLYLIVVKGDVLNPLLWLRTLTSPSAWLYFVPHILIIFCSCLICAKDYVLSSSFSSTRFQKFLSVFSLRNLILLSLHGLVGIVQVWLALRLGEFKQDSIFVEDTLFLILGGLWTGLYYFAKVYVSDKHLDFPVIQQRKLTQFRSSLFTLLRDSCKQSLYPSVYFITFYYLWGNEFKQYFTFIFEVSSIESPLRIYSYHWLFASLFFFNMNLIKLLFGIFLTEVVEFPLIKQSNVLTLQESVNLQDLPIVQRLACLDLNTLSLWSPLRRQVFFSLSQPGEHPHNWNSLIEAILKLYNAYIEVLDKTIDSIGDKSGTITGVKPPSAPSVKQFRNLRNMTTPSILDTSRFYETTAQSTKDETISDTLLVRLRGKISNFLKITKKLLGIDYFFGEIPQASIQKCLSDGHLIIWSAQGLSELICASLNEDRYGIVQKDLAVVITTLVRLSQVLDKLNKIPALSKRIAGTDNFNYKVKNAVSSSVKRSLFNICNTFRNYFNEIPLNKDTVNYLCSAVLVKNSTV